MTIYREQKYARWNQDDISIVEALWATCVTELGGAYVFNKMKVALVI